MNQENERHCGQCKYAIRIDRGWSNWTVEGTDLDCLKGLNPQFPVDAWYGECPEGNFANNCPCFIEGSGVSVDVDQELGDITEYSDDFEIKGLLKNLYK